MKVELKHFEHGCNGLSLIVIPETTIEHDLLTALWRHGQLEMCHPGKSHHMGTGHIVRWKPIPVDTAATTSQ